jgi:hypothetical protein
MFKLSVSGLEIREYGRRDPSRRSRDTLYPQKLALTSPTSGGLSVGIVRSRIQATELSFLFKLSVSIILVLVPSVDAGITDATIVLILVFNSIESNVLKFMN